MKNIWAMTLSFCVFGLTVLNKGDCQAASVRWCLLCDGSALEDELQNAETESYGGNVSTVGLGRI